MKFQKPDLSGLDRAAILAARADAVRLASEIDTGEDTLSADALTDLEAIAEFLVEADAAVEQIDADAADHAERLAKARGGIVAKEDEPVAKEDEPVVEPEAAKEEEPVLVASARTSVTAKAASRQVTTAPEVSTKAVATITAAADVPGIPTGKVLESLDDVVEAAIARFAAMPNRKVGNVRNRYGLAQITKGRDDEFSYDNPDYKSMQDLIQAASKESRLSGGNLVAAGGWCAPSETLYDLCTIESTDGLWDVPEVRAPRGGIQFTKGPSFADIYANGGFLQTEAQAEAGTDEKECWDVECPPFQEVRMDAIGLCIRAGILTNAAYPELIRRYLEGAIIAQQHRVSADLIQRALTITGAGETIANPWENATALLTALEIAILGERQRNRLPLSMTLEVVLPFWVKGAIRADLSQRTGVDLLNVTDQVIESYFSVRGARVQWVYNWQDLTITSGVDPNVVQVAATDFPATVQALMYPAGTFVKLGLDVISLDAVYDSTNIVTNTYTALFAEEGIALANTCFDARRITLPMNVSGLTAAAIINQDWNAAPPLYTEA